jgi:hypothetical protein
MKNFKNLISSIQKENKLVKSKIDKELQKSKFIIDPNRLRIFWSLDW